MAETHEKREETHACDLISRQAAVEALNKTARDLFTLADSYEFYIKALLHAEAEILGLPSAQPELVEKVAYIRGFEQGRTQGMIDTKAEEVAQPNLQPTCNQLATDTIRRQAAISEIMEDLEDRSLHDDPATPEDYAEGYDEGIRNAAAIVLQMPSAQPERLTDDDFETIRILLNADKENLCNQRRWKEAEKYQRIIDRFMAFASAQPAEADVQKMQGLEQAEIQKAYELGKLDAMEEMPHWIPRSERKPPDEIDPHTLDYKLYACSCVFGTVEAVRAYKYGEGHFWNGPGIVDEYVVAWMPFPEPYRAAGGETDGEA